MTTLDYRNTAASEVHSHWLHRVALLTALCTFVLIFIGGLVTSKHAGMSVPDWPNSYGYNMFLFPPSKWVGGILFEHTHRLMGTVVGFCATVLTLMAWAPGKSAPGRHWIVRIFAGVSLLNAMGTGAMMIWPGAFRLAPPAGSPMNIFSQGAVTEAGLLLCAMVAYACRRREPRRWVRWIATACLIVVCIQGLLGGLRVDLINLTLAMVHGCFAQAAFCLIVLAWIVTGSWWQTAPELSRGEDSASGWRCSRWRWFTGS
jgi:cytochrome c oxidase assembly protein subunit 15